MPKKLQGKPPMPKSYANAEIQGHLGKDPQSATTTNGNQYCKFSIAVNRRKKISGEWADDGTDWYYCTAWGSQAEWCQSNLSKGVCANVQGRISINEKDGKRYTDIVVNEARVIEKEVRQQKPVVDDDDIPF